MPATGPKRKTKKPVSNGTGGGNYTEAAMDEFLKRHHLYRKPIAKDGSCLFRAVSEQVRIKLEFSPSVIRDLYISIFIDTFVMINLSFMRTMW